MEVLGAVIGCVGNCISPHASNCWEHHKNIKKNSKELEAASKKLDARKKDIEERLKGIVKLGVTKEANEVLHWLESVEGICKEIDGIKEKVREIKFYERAGCGEEVVEMTRKVEKLYQEGEFPDGGLVRELPQRGKELPTTTILEDETTSHKMRKKILACLLDENVSKIGVFGMGGIGKTTALEHINNELLRNPKFDKVIFVTVSKALDVKSLQDKIASNLKFGLVKDADERSRAAELLGKLKESKRFVLILDDMWEGFALKNVGIPEPNSENGCKLVLTTRSSDVCSKMSCEPIIQMETLSEDEALNLFRNSVGKRVLSNPKLEKMVKEVAQECACLPLAIVTVAGFLRDKDDPNYWVIALEDLKKATSSISNDITEILRLSYDRLKDKKHQECLLYCALYPEDYPIERDLLIDQLIAVGIVDETMVLPTERGQVMLNHLVSVSLLIDTIDDAKCVKLHDSIRDMALQIMRESPTRFLAKAGEGVESIPAEMIWSEGVEMVSLMRSEIVEISIEQPNCPMLSSLFLNQNYYLKSIPRNFFQQMLGLNVLDLSDTQIVELPESVSFLLNLSVLSLRHCRILKHVPNLSKLSNMRRLDLSHTSIEEVPKGTEKLVKLTYLDLSVTIIKEVPKGILCNLTNLQYLLLLPSYEGLAVTEELGNHRNLKTLRCKFAEFKHFNASVRSLEEGSLTNFRLTIKDSWYKVIDKLNVVKLNDCDTTVSSESAYFPLSLPKNVDILQMFSCRINVRSLCELTSILLFPSHLSYPSKDREFVGIEGEGVQPSLQAGSFSSLKYLRIEKCGNIKKLFTLKNASFPNLEQIQIRNCKELEEIVSTSRENEIEEGGAAHHTTTVDVVTLPKLMKLGLSNLPKLQSIPFVADFLQSLMIWNCPNLKRIPFLDREPWHPSLIEVDIDEESWSSLEWNYLKDKDAYWREFNFY